VGKKPYTSKKQEHPLVEPRLVAAVGLVALGAGVGIGLMLARILVLPGLILALASAIGVLSIYSKHFAYLYRCLKKKQRYDGPGLIELLIAVVMITVITVLAPVIYLNVQAEEIILNRAEIRLDGISPQKEYNSSFYNIFVQFTNRGSLTLYNGAMISTAFLGVITQEKIDRTLDELDQQLQQPQHGQKATIADTVSGGTIIITVPDFQVTEDQIKSIKSGDTALYILHAFYYQDDAVRSKGYWHGKFCEYFTFGQRFFHNCGLNHIELLTGAKFN
jgi:hypothetical protein